MPQKWNLQDIRPAATAKNTVKPSAPRAPQSDIAPKSRPSAQPEAAPVYDPELSTLDIIDGNAARRKRMFVTTLIVALLIAFGFSINLLLGGAEVTVSPKAKDVIVQSEITARTVPQAGDLSYELLTLESTAEKQVKAAGKEDVSLHATGKIFVYNKRTDASQRLITNTRFESPEGLIYRIKESIEVPAATTDVKGTVVPGKVVADVYADGTGEKYNIAPTTFTVPGLKDSPQYDAVYAESTAAFEGGFEGEKYIIDDAELQTAQQELHLELRNMLLEQLAEKVPAGFIAYEGAVTFVFESLPSTEYGDSLATIKELARLQVPLFKEDEFAKYLAEKTVPEYENDDVYVLDPSTLVFAYTDPLIEQIDIKDLSELVFTLKGTAKIVWEFDSEELKASLVGKKKSDGATVFAGYRSIANAQAEVKPFWSTKFPDNADEITVETLIP